MNGVSSASLPAYQDFLLSMKNLEQERSPGRTGRQADRQSGQGRAGQGKAGQDKAGQGRQAGRARQGRAGKAGRQGREGKGRQAGQAIK